MKKSTKKLLVFILLNLGYIGFVYTEITYYVAGIARPNYVVWAIGSVAWIVGTISYYGIKDINENE